MACLFVDHCGVRLCVLHQHKGRSSVCVGCQFMFLLPYRFILGEVVFFEIAEQGCPIRYDIFASHTLFQSVRHF